LPSDRSRISITGPLARRTCTSFVRQRKFYRDYEDCWPPLNLERCWCVMTVRSDPHGEIALMLCESLLHVLVEEGVLPKEKALQAIVTVAELVREMGETGAAVNIIEDIARSFTAKD
jgi:hypothetical protein